MSRYKITIEDSEIQISETEAHQLDVVTTQNQLLHVLHKNKPYHVKVVRSDWREKRLDMEVNGNKYTVKIEDQYDQIATQMGLLAAEEQKINNLKAPMPGLIVEVLVNEGDEIVKGTQLLVLSAMKMENIISAPGDGVVKRIEVSKDDAVEKGQLLVVVE